MTTIENVREGNLSLATESEALSRLRILGQRCARPDAAVQDCLQDVLGTAMWMTAAEKGNIQLYDAASGALRLTVHKGFTTRFVDFFAAVRHGDAATCASAFGSGKRIVVDDVVAHPIFAGTPSLDVLLDSGIRAVQSTPLTSGTGNILGMVSTHWSEPRGLDDRECRLLDLLARQAADYLERKRSEEALRETAQQLRIVTDSMAAPVTRCTRDLKYGWVSKPYAEWLGRPAEEITGRTIVDIIGSEAFEQLGPHFEQVLRGEVVRYEEQVTFRGIGPRWIVATYTPTFDASGVCDGWVAVVMDIDERKRMEEALREHERALEDAARRKDEFLAMLGHELRNPLSAIRNAVATATLDGERRNVALAIARRQTEQLARMVDDLLDVARITQGRIILQREPLALKSVVERAIETARPLRGPWAYGEGCSPRRRDLRGWRCGAT
jgi:two-component system CheB/CheR fusion protein